MTFYIVLYNINIIYSYIKILYIIYIIMNINLLRGDLPNKKNPHDNILTHDITELLQKPISVEYWRSKINDDGSITQNLKIYVWWELLVDWDDYHTKMSEEELWHSRTCHIRINKSDKPIKIFTNDPNDVRYIDPWQAYMWDICIPKKIQWHWLGRKIYQAIADFTRYEIVKWDTISVCSEWMWAHFNSFKPN